MSVLTRYSARIRKENDGRLFEGAFAAAVLNVIWEIAQYSQPASFRHSLYISVMLRASMLVPLAIIAARLVWPAIQGWSLGFSNPLRQIEFLDNEYWLTKREIDGLPLAPMEKAPMYVAHLQQSMLERARFRRMITDPPFLYYRAIIRLKSHHLHRQSDRKVKTMYIAIRNVNSSVTFTYTDGKANSSSI